MQSSQVPIWVPILVGLIGIAGIILGQLINAWQETRKLAIEEKVKDRSHWRDQRLSLYVEALRYGDRAIKFLVRTQLASEGGYKKGLIDDYRVELNEIIERVDYCEPRFSLLTTSKIQDFYADFIRKIGLAYKACTSLKANSGYSEALAKSIRDTVSSFDQLTVEMRKDLGVGPRDDE
ncbi:hypothetical protein [Amycolatopsis sp. BJA-103]|uniref:hypothetical protein n=1 Tax=Amycolatopsis sp. BJA-103 TaxID=1911175 RepID=UPI0011AF7178|nr:hypothetical protein [Amycolatopsis sp. BJA-103]